jgi:CDP-diacylglycerol---serine O-phosphatidyltransferase
MPDPTPSHHIQIWKMVPNLLTLAALIAGMTSIQKAINGNFEAAVLMLVAAAIFDVMDGAVARALKASSDIGAELDSLSDFLAFGVAPSVLLYEWVLDDAGKLGWIATIVLPAAAALRLARFNVLARLTVDIPDWKRGFFIGVPTPAGAGLAMLPLYIWLLDPGMFEVFTSATPLIAVWCMVVAALMVSRLPTFSLKKLKIPQRMVVPLMGAIALVIAALIHTPWILLSGAAITYTVSIPFVIRRYRKLEKEFAGAPEDLSSLAFGIDLRDGEN